MRDEPGCFERIRHLDGLGMGTRQISEQRPHVAACRICCLAKRFGFVGRAANVVFQLFGKGVQPCCCVLTHHRQRVDMVHDPGSFGIEAAGNIDQNCFQPGLLGAQVARYFCQLCSLTATEPNRNEVEQTDQNQRGTRCIDDVNESARGEPSGQHVNFCPGDEYDPSRAGHDRQKRSDRGQEVATGRSLLLVSHRVGQFARRLDDLVVGVIGPVPRELRTPIHDRSVYHEFSALGKAVVASC